MRIDCGAAWPDNETWCWSSPLTALPGKMTPESEVSRRNGELQFDSSFLLEIPKT